MKNQNDIDAQLSEVAESYYPWISSLAQKFEAACTGSDSWDEKNTDLILHLIFAGAVKLTTILRYRQLLSVVELRDIQEEICTAMDDILRRETQSNQVLVSTSKQSDLLAYHPYSHPFRQPLTSQEWLRKFKPAWLGLQQNYLFELARHLFQHGYTFLVIETGNLTVSASDALNVISVLDIADQYSWRDIRTFCGEYYCLDLTSKFKCLMVMFRGDLYPHTSSAHICPQLYGKSTRKYRSALGGIVLQPLIKAPEDDPISTKPPSEPTVQKNRKVVLRNAGYSFTDSDVLAKNTTLGIVANDLTNEVELESVRVTITQIRKVEAMNNARFARYVFVLGHGAKYSREFPNRSEQAEQKRNSLTEAGCVFLELPLNDGSLSDMSEALAQILDKHPVKIASQVTLPVCHIQQNPNRDPDPYFTSPLASEE